MKLLAATTRTQGHRPGDFNHCIDRELVMAPVTICDAEAEAEDPNTGGCGCARSFVGLSSACGTTTAEIRELDTDPHAYTLAISDGLTRQGCPTTHAPAIARDLAEFAERHPLGLVVRYRVGELYVLGGRLA